MTSSDKMIDSINLSGRQFQVLKFLAENGAANAYQIQRNTNMRYSTVHKTVKDLQHRQFIALFAETKNPKGVVAKAYRLTLKGLLAALAFGADMRKAATNWAWLLPLIFGKLEYLESCGLTVEIKAFLLDEAKRWNNIVYDQWNDELAQYEVMSHFRDAVFKLFILDEKDKAWLKAIRGDLKLRQWAIETLKDEISTVEALINLFKCELEVVESTAEPNWSKVTQNLKKWANVLLARYPG